jgi:hypothetical protein
MVVILPAKRVTHLIAGRDRAAEIAFGVVCIEGHQVTSIDTLTEFGVVVEKFDSTDTIEVSPSQLQRAEALARRNETSRPRPDRRPSSNPRLRRSARRTSSLPRARRRTHDMDVPRLR